VPESLVPRRVFPSWSVGVPESLSETVAQEGYWHAYDGNRSVSMTSVVVHDKHGPVSARKLAAEYMAVAGTPVPDRPPGLDGRAVLRTEVLNGETKNVLQGLLAATGTVLLITITGADLAWAMGTWLSVRHHPQAQPRRRRRR
jgi:hypothetical protein